MVTSIDDWKALRNACGTDDRKLAAMTILALRGYRAMGSYEDDIETLRNLIRVLSGNYVHPPKDESD
jgi:hypothetical protein